MKWLSVNTLLVPDDSLTVDLYALKMAEKPRVYQSFLLRMWQADGNGKPVWRCSLENPQTGECHIFPDVEALFSFLRSTAVQTQEPRGRNQAA